MHHSKQEKIVILKYARNCGSIPRTAKHFNVSTTSIKKWDKEFNILGPKKKTQKVYTNAERHKILEYARVYGRDAAVKEFGVCATTLYNWNQKFKILDSTPRKTYTDAEKIEICTYARKYGTNAAHRNYGVMPSYIKKWILDLNIPKRPGRKPKMRRDRAKKNYTEAEIMERLEYARDYGVLAAKRHYQLGGSSLQNWNKIYKVYIEKEPARVFSREEKIQIVTDAKEIGIIAAAEKHSVSPNRISIWNSQLGGVYKAKPYTKYTEEYRMNVADYALSHSIVKASDKFGVSTSLISRWIRKNKTKTA